MNNVTLFGRIEEEPQLLGMPGRDVFEFWLCMRPRNERHVQQVKVVAFRELALRCSKHLSKGDQVGVTGHLRSEAMPSQSSRRRMFVHSVIARQVDFVDSAAAGPEDGEGSR